MSPTSYRSFSPGELLCGLREMWSTMISAAVSMLFRKEVLLIHGELDEKVPVYAVGPYLDLYGQKARLEIIKGANHQFTSVEWKNKVYELSIEYIKEKTGSIEK